MPGSLGCQARDAEWPGENVPSRAELLSCFLAQVDFKALLFCPRNAPKAEWWRLNLDSGYLRLWRQDMFDMGKMSQRFSIRLYVRRPQFGFRQNKSVSSGVVQGFYQRVQRPDPEVDGLREGNC